MFFSFYDTALKFRKKGVFSGTPIRDNIFKGNKSIVKERLHITNSKPTILIIGGSTGATAINRFIVNNLNELTKNYNIIHITGKDKSININHKNLNYYQFEYVDDIQNYLSVADIIISRAGSNAIFEFLALKKLMLLIPLPKEESRGDQILNAEYFYCNNLAEVLEQKNLNIENLNNKLKSIIANKNKILKSINDYNLTNGTNIILKEINKHIE